VIGSPYSEENPERVPIRWVTSGLWKLEGFYNQSIGRNLIAKGIMAGKLKDVYWTDLGPLAVALLRGINKKAQKPILDAFLKVNESVRLERPHGCNLYIPKNLGGVGVPLPHGSTFESVQSKSLAPNTLVQQKLKAAYLATHGARRLELPNVGLEDSGRVTRAIKKARMTGPGRMVRPNYERKCDMGLNGTQLLSRVIQEYQRQPHYGEDTLPEVRVEKPDPTWKNDSLSSPAAHRAKNFRLARKYLKFVQSSIPYNKIVVGENTDGTKKFLSPMSVKGILQFEETEMLDTLWPVTSEACPERNLDVYEASLEIDDFISGLWEAT
jgi:hypothetical protein